MKKTVFTIALFIGLQLSLTAVAQNNEQVALRVPNFVRPLVEKWVTEYQKTNTNVDFLIVSGKSQDNTSNTISFTTESGIPDSLKQNVTFARFAALAVTSKGSDAEQLIGSQSLNAKKLKNLFFIKDELDDNQKETKLEKQLHVITGNNQQSASRLYASRFHQEIANYKGKKIQGDDSYLNIAISRDPLAITVNSLSNVYDISTRKLRQSLVILPLDIDKEGHQIINEGRLDDVISLLEREDYAEIPVGHINMSYDQTNSVLNDFVYWVLTDGVESLHQYGLLSLSKKELAVQLKRVEQLSLAQK